MHAIDSLIKFALFLAAVLFFGFFASLSLTSRTLQMGDLSRRAEDKDAIHSYAETISLNEMEKALDTAWRKQNVVYISKPEIPAQMEANIKAKLVEEFGSGANNISISNIKIEIGRGSYNETPFGSGIYTQADNQRPYVKGSLTMHIKPSINKAAPKTIASEKIPGMLNQDLEWFIYANAVAPEYVE